MGLRSPSARCALRLLLAALCVVSACECGESSPLGRVRPEIQVEPEALNFGEVPLGATRRLALSIGNRGTADLTIAGLDVGAPFLVQPGSLLVRPGETETIAIGFRPGNGEQAAGTLLIASNDEARPMLSVPLSGTGVEGRVTVEPHAIDFRDTRVGSARAAELALRNLGIEPVEGRIVALGFDRPEHFSLGSFFAFSEVGVLGLGPRSSAVFEIEYHPIEVGADQGLIVFETCGEGCGLEVEVVASAADAVVRLEPPVVDFGTVGIGVTRTEQIVVRNVGAEPVQILGVVSSGGPELRAAATRPLPAALEGGASLAVRVEFTPTSASELTGKVIVTTSDPQVPEAEAGLVGRGEGPLFLVEPEAVAFGVVRDEGPHRRAVLLLNAGSSEVRIESLGVSGAPELSLFSAPGLPARLGPGESILADLAYAPRENGEHAATLLVETDDPDAARVEVPLSGGRAERACVVSIEPARINFGVLIPGFRRTKSALLTNVGSSPCNFIGGAFRPPVDPAIALVSTPWPSALAPGQSMGIDLSFAPAAEVDSKANLVLVTDDPVFPERHLTALGTARGYVDLFTDPASVDFGLLSPGCNLGRETIRVLNAGTTGAEISSVALFASSPEFFFASPLATPHVLPSGGSASFTVAWVPADLGQDQAEIEIHAKDLPYPLVVPLRGEGAIDPRMVDEFEQEANERVDVLFVVDDSCSMFDDQAALAHNFESFIRQADVRQVDFQIGVTTTTLFPDPGLLKGPVMTRGTRDLETVFAAQANVGILGSGFEQGLEAMLQAFLRAEAGGSPNATLFRGGAARVVIIVSDEDDQSPAAPLVYFSELRQRSRGGLVTAMVTGQASGCQHPVTGSADRAPRYEELARLSGGLSESICADWAMTLANIGVAAFGLKREFPLSQPADVSKPILVTVNGAVEPSASWAYDAASRSIRFSTPPPEGASIRVEYSPLC